MGQASISRACKYASQVLVNGEEERQRYLDFRFDGRLGFPGGLLDPGESIEIALNR